MAQKTGRKQYFVGKKFQTKYVGVMLILVLLTGLVSGAGVYLTIKSVINQKLPSVSQQLLVGDVVFGEVNRIITFALPIVAILVVIISVYVSHKIAGPEYRLSKVLDNVSRGDFTGSTKLRKRDELQSLAGKMGEANRNLSSMISQQRQMIKHLVSEFYALKAETEKDKMKTDKLTSMAANIAKKAEALEKDFEQYKIQ